MRTTNNGLQTETRNQSTENYNIINKLNLNGMEVRFFEELNGSKAASVEPRKNDKKSRSKAYKRGMELLGWHAVSWLYEHQWLEHGWRGEGRTWWLKYQRYLRGIGLKHTRISGKEVVDINPWYEVKLANGSSKFINGCCPACCVWRW